MNVTHVPYDPKRDRYAVPSPDAHKAVEEAWEEACASGLIPPEPIEEEAA